MSVMLCTGVIFILKNLMTSYYSPVEILANLKNYRNLQFSSFYVEFYGEFNGASCQIFLLGKRSYEQKRTCRYFAQN